MRHEVWTALVVVAAVSAVCQMHAKSLAYVAGFQRIQSSRRSVRDTSSSPSTTSPPSPTPSQSSPSPHSYSPSSPPPSPSAPLPSFTSQSSQTSTSFSPHPSSPSKTTPPKVSPSSPALSKPTLYPSLVVLPSSTLRSPNQTQFSYWMSLTFHLFSSAFYLMSSIFQLQFPIIHLRPPSHVLPHSPVKSTLPSVTVSLRATTSPSLPSSDDSTDFWSNGSLIGLELDCDDAVKYCLSFGRLLYEPTGQCFRLGDSRPCGDGRFLVLDAEGLKSGRIRAVCRGNGTCEGLIMAYDGRCYNKSNVRKDLCDNSALLVPYPTGMYECACYTIKCLFAKESLLQPNTTGRCVLPDLNRPPMASFPFPCSDKAVNCSRPNLFFQGKCCTPLTNESCPDGQWLILEERDRNVSATCASRRPCGLGRQKMNADGLCHSEEEIRQTLCPGETLYPLPNGLMQCSFSSFSLLGLENESNCAIYLKGSSGNMGISIYGPSSECGRNDGGFCSPGFKPILSIPVITPEN